MPQGGAAGGCRRGCCSGLPRRAPNCLQRHGAAWQTAGMLTRRLLLAAIPATLAAKAQAAPATFAGFLAGMRAEARREGISPAVLHAALTGLAPNPKVLERDRHQPEFTMTWAQYRALLITDKRIDAGRAAVRDNRRPAASGAGAVWRRPRSDHRDLGAGIQLRHSERGFPSGGCAGHAGLGRPPRQLLPSGTDGRADASWITAT